MSIDGRTQLAFLLGYPVEHSLSPAMHQAAFAVTGLNAVYLPWSVSPAFLPDAVRGQHHPVPRGHTRGGEHGRSRVPDEPAGVGLRPTDPLLFDYAGLSAATVVCDLIYRPAETPLLAAARQQGCRTVNGLSMLLHQGALAFERWVGRGAPIGAMRQALGLP